MIKCRDGVDLGMTCVVRVIHLCVFHWAMCGLST